MYISHKIHFQYIS